MTERYSARAMAVHGRRRARMPPAAAAFALLMVAMVVASADAGGWGYWAPCAGWGCGVEVVAHAAIVLFPRTTRGMLLTGAVRV